MREIMGIINIFYFFKYVELEILKYVTWSWNFIRKSISQHVGPKFEHPKKGQRSRLLENSLHIYIVASYLIKLL